MKANHFSCIKSLILFSAAFFFITTLSFAQSDSSKFNSYGGNNYIDSWTFQAGYANYTEYTNTHDIFINAAKKISKVSALRAGISFVGLLDPVYKYSKYNSTFYNLVEGVNLTNTNGTIHGVGLNLQYLFYPIKDKVGNIYLGTGPEFIFYKEVETQIINSYSSLPASQDNNYKSNQTDSNRENVSLTDKAWAVGLSLSLGIELYPTKMMGIFAEYGIMLMNSHQSMSASTQNVISGIVTKNNSNVSRFRFIPSILELGLSFRM